ncbi:MAG TPA: hypothetical protein VKA46_08565 [Gemmataceae bacterium]|nr:hypothetical protein [Gemmataceae bacterium]
MKWLQFDGSATPAQLAMVNRILNGWEREQKLPEFLLGMLIDNFIAELRDAKEWLEKELAQQD